MASKFGRLERIDLRDGWISEAGEFTPWLAQSDNLEILSEAVGLELELEAQERNVGPFRADILCKDVSTGHWVLIENQLERTDHSHLGQLLTYAAGLQAVTIVWIAARFTEQHRATLDWLNEITDERFNFFGLEIELWKIGDSLSAPKFSVVSQPNEWSRDVSAAARSIETELLSETKAVQLSFWGALRARLENQVPGFKFRKPLPQHWYDFSMGRAGYWLSLTLNSQERRAGVEFNMNNSKEVKRNFDALFDQRERLEKSFGHELHWLPLSGRKSSRVVIYLTGMDPLNENNWIDIIDWMRDMMMRFQTVFGPLIRTLPS